MDLGSIILASPWRWEVKRQIDWVKGIKSVLLKLSHCVNKIRFILREYKTPPSVSSLFFNAYSLSERFSVFNQLSGIPKIQSSFWKKVWSHSVFGSYFVVSFMFLLLLLPTYCLNQWSVTLACFFIPIFKTVKISFKGVLMHYLHQISKHLCVIVELIVTSKK